MCYEQSYTSSSRSGVSALSRGVTDWYQSHGYRELGYQILPIPQTITKLPKNYVLCATCILAFNFMLHVYTSSLYVCIHSFHMDQEFLFLFPHTPHILYYVSTSFSTKLLLFTNHYTHTQYLFFKPFQISKIIISIFKTVSIIK